MEHLKLVLNVEHIRARKNSLNGGIDVVNVDARRTEIMQHQH